MVITNIRRNICRHKGKTILNVGIAVMIVFFLNAYMGNLESIERQLERLSDVLSVSGRVCNLNGSQTVGLEISEETLEGIRTSPCVKRVTYSIQFAGAEGEFPKEEWRNRLNLPIQAVNELDWIAGVEEGSVQLAGGIQEDFIKSDVPYILIDQFTLEQRGWKIGDKIPLTIYYYAGTSQGETEWKYLMVEEFVIIGTMQISGNADVTALMNGVVSCAWAESRLKAHQCSYFADSLSFELESGEELNSFKEEMKNLGLMEVVTTANQDISGSALILEDTTYIQTAEQFRRNIQMFQRYLPLLFIIVIGAGYTISYLIVQSRKNEYAIMRMLGQSKKNCFLQFAGEFLAVEGFGGMIGMVIAVFALPVNKWMALVILAVFLICYLCGTMMALAVLSRKPLITALAQKE